MMLLAWYRSRRARAPLFAGLLRPPHTDQAGRVTQHERGKGGVESSPYARVARPSTPPASPAFPAVACSRRPDAPGARPVRSLWPRARVLPPRSPTCCARTTRTPCGAVRVLGRVASCADARAESRRRDDGTDTTCGGYPVGRETNWQTRGPPAFVGRSEEHTSELQSRQYFVCRLLLEKKKK